jgi:aryl-alcohol dehydrogenase-like predicted oxidoreductase
LQAGFASPLSYWRDTIVADIAEEFAMETRPLGRTGLRVSALGLGTMTWGMQNSEAQAHENLAVALDHGVNFLDTAELYAVPASAETFGTTETIIGNWLRGKGARRERIILASKVTGPGRPWIREGRPPGPADMRQALEGSLKRLNTDYLDLYQIHWPSRPHYHWEGGWNYAPQQIDPMRAREDIATALETLTGFVREGKVRHVGVSNETGWGLMHALKLAETSGLPRLASVQNEYSLLRRNHDHDLAEIGLLEDVALLAYSPLAGGVLTGKYLDGQLPAGTRGTWGGMYRINPHSDAATRAYLDIARRHGLSLPQMALAFCRSRPFMTSVLIGATSRAQLEENLSSAEITLSVEIAAEIAAVYKLHPRTI